MIKAMSFDLDGVFFTQQSFKDFKKHLPKRVEDKETVDYVFHNSQEMLDFKSGKISEEEFWNFATKTLQIEGDFDDICSVFREVYTINNDVANYVREVKIAGYKTCICSNNFETRVREVDNEWGFLDLFDVKIFSYQVGFLKPDKRIFQALIDASEVKPGEIVYSDDGEDKIQGALELGINAFVYENFEQFKNKLTSLGVKT